MELSQIQVSEGKTWAQKNPRTSETEIENLTKNTAAKVNHNTK